MGFGMGPIPYPEIRHYAEDFGLEVDRKVVFIRVILAMDEAFLEWHQAEQERRKKEAGEEE